jgi:hypothetical protein
MSVRDGAPAESARGFARGKRQRASQRRVVEQFASRIREGTRILRWDENPSARRIHNFGKRSSRACDKRDSCGHRFGSGQAEAFEARWHQLKKSFGEELVSL